KGSLDGSLLPGESSIGDVVRAEVETTLDGTDVKAIIPVKEKKADDDNRIELITRNLRDDELVTETRSKRGRRGRDERRGGRDRRRRREGGRDERRGGNRGSDRRERSRGDRPDRPRRERSAPPSR